MCMLIRTMIRKTGTQTVNKHVLVILVAFAVTNSGALSGEDMNPETAPTASEVAPEPLPIHVLLKKPRDSLFGISPDGSKVASMQWDPSGYFMMVHSTTDGQQIQDIPFGQKKLSCVVSQTPAS